jgi:hypothetical protein
MTWGVEMRPAVGLRGAVDVVRTFLREEVEAEGMGSRDFDGGQIYRNGECVAVVSYNGRVWAPGGTNPEGIHVPSLGDKEILVA